MTASLNLGQPCSQPCLCNFSMTSTSPHSSSFSAGLTAAHGISFTPSPVAPTLHRTASIFLSGFGIGEPGIQCMATSSRCRVAPRFQVIQPSPALHQLIAVQFLLQCIGCNCPVHCDKSNGFGTTESDILCCVNMRSQCCHPLARPTTAQQSI